MNATFSKEIHIFSKTELKTIFLKLAYIGQNQDSGLYPKNQG